jgi:hypothetical protein
MVYLRLLAVPAGTGKLGVAPPKNTTLRLWRQKTGSIERKRAEIDGNLFKLTIKSRVFSQPATLEVSCNLSAIDGGPERCLPQGSRAKGLRAIWGALGSLEESGVEMSEKNEARALWIASLRSQ